MGTCDGGGGGHDAADSTAPRRLTGVELTPGTVIARSFKTLIVAGTYTPMHHRGEGGAVRGAAVLDVAGKTWQYGTKPGLKAMEAEVQLMQQLGRHDCLLRVFGIAETTHSSSGLRRQWLVTERWSWSLEDVLLGRVAGVALEGSISRLEALVEVGRGLTHMHSKYVLHRDMALRNVLLRPRLGGDGDGGGAGGGGAGGGGAAAGAAAAVGAAAAAAAAAGASAAATVGGSSGFAACLCDFGISVAAYPASAAGVYRPESSRLSLHGPVRSAAPEVLSTEGDGFPVYSAASDVWAFGVCIWSLLVQQQPYSDISSNTAAVRQHVLEDGGRLAAVSTYRSSGTGVVAEFDEAALAALDLLLATCFATDRAQRPSAATVTRKLEELLLLQRQQHRQQEGPPRMLEPSVEMQTQP